LSGRRLVAALPNLISLARLLAVPVTVWLIMNERLGLAFWMFVAAGISDAIDGFIAKHFGAKSVIGGYLDPLADKALLTSVYVTLGYVGHMASWLVILVVFRDVLIIGGAILYQTLTQNLTMQPLFVSKINTTAQIALAAVMLAQSGLGVDYGLADILVPVVAATTLASGGAYLGIWGWKALRMEGLQ
jgi:cardiolipin synthase